MSEISELAGSLSDRGTVRLAVKGAQDFSSGEKLRWDFRVTARVSVKR